MRYIERRDSPDDFKDFIKNWPSDVRLTWSSFQNPEKASVKASLVSGQRGLCCYCECEIVLDNSHIEHLSPRSKDDAKVVDYDNFAASCLKDTEKGAPLTCGKARDNWDEAKSYLNPYDPSCKGELTFELSGRISEKKYQKFVTKLNLNEGLKVNARLKAVEFLDNPEAEGLDVADIEEYFLKKLAQDSYPEFISFMLYYAKENYGIVVEVP